MTSIRAATPADVDQIAALFLRVFQKGSRHRPPAVAAYFHRLYFENPWRSEGLDSLVMEHDGTLVGFIGVIPMPLSIDGRTVRAAVGGNLMVDPELNDPLTTVRMVRRYLHGGQDLSFTDTANVAGAAMWTGLGGRIARFPSMRWLVPLRPAGFVAAVGTRARPRAIRRIATGLTAPIDVLRPSRLRWRLPEADRARIREIGAQELRQIMEAVGDRTYATFGGDDAGFEWLIDRCGEREQFGPLRSIAIDGRDGHPIGAVLYYPNPNGIGQVLGCWARRRHHAEVLDLLLADAAAHRSTALQGQADAHLFDALGDRLSLYLQRNESVTVHAADAALVQRIVDGELVLGRLFGEWWTRMQGDVFR